MIANSGNPNNQKIKQQKNSKMGEYGEAVIEYLEDIMQEEDLYVRKNYLIISSFEKAETNLKEFYYNLKYGLGNIKISCNMLDDGGIIELIHRELNKNSTENIEKIIKEGGLDIYVKGKKEKREEAINKKQETEFAYITDLPITNKNIKATIELGRRRWKIENEGFNIQKNGTWDIGHLYSKNQTAIKVHYLMVQIAHIIRQLLEKGISEIKSLKLKLKEISHLLKKELISTITKVTAHNKMQLRFD